MDDRCDVVHVDATRGHIRCHQRLRATGAEVLERAVTLVLRAVAVDRGGGDAGVGQLLGDPLGAALGATEDDGRAHAVDDLTGGCDAFGAFDGPEVVLQVGQLVVWDLELVQHRVVLVVAHEHVDVAVERRREQHRLAVITATVEKATHLGEEPHVRHPVGFVEHDHLDVVQSHHLLVDQVRQTTWARHGDVHTAVERPLVSRDRHTAEERGDPRASAAGEELELVGHLGGELSGRDQDESTWPSAVGPGAADDERDAEGQRLAGTSGGLARDVSSGERVAQGQRLDGEGRVDAALGERGDDVGGNAEIGEGGVHYHSDVLVSRTWSWCAPARDVWAQVYPVAALAAVRGRGSQVVARRTAVGVTTPATGERSRCTRARRDAWTPG